MLAGRFGFARTLAAGEIGKAAGALGIGALLALHDVAPIQFILVAALCQLAGGIGYTVAAIPDGMIATSIRGLPDVPREAGQADARAASLMFAAFMLAGLLGAAIAQVVFWIPFLLGGIASLVAAGAALGLSPLDQPATSGGQATARPAAPSVRPALTAAARDAILVYGLYRGTSLSLQVGIMPILLFMDRHIPIWLFGVAFASYTFAGFLSAKYYPVLAKRLGERQQLAAIGLLSIIAFSGLALLPGLWVAIAPVPLFLVAGLVRPYCLPRLTADVADPAVRQARIALAERTFALVSAGTTLAAFTLLWLGIQLPIFLGALGCLILLVTLMQVARRTG